MCEHPARFLLCALPAFVVGLVFSVLSSVSFAGVTCTITDDEEYRVFAAVLFPNPPEAPDTMKTDLERNAYISLHTVRLDGFHGSSYTIRDEALTATAGKGSDSPTGEGPDSENEQPCRIDEGRLRAYVPKGRSVTVVSGETLRKSSPPLSDGPERPRDGRWLPGPVTYLSRPSFDRTRTEAVIQASTAAGPRMGVGYRVYLKKSSATGKWIIVGASRTHIL